VRIRHFGLLTNRHRRATIARARQLLDAPPPSAPSTDALATAADPTRCPVCCQGYWHVVEILRPLAPAPLHGAWNTS
jgi:hypothetical protein